MNNAITHTDVLAFRDHLIQEKKLGIGAYLSRLNQDPFFLIAATGLGKTFVIPLHLLEIAMRARPEGTAFHDRDAPKIWVVEPKIAIAQSLEQELNRLWREFNKTRGIQADPLFGCKTKVDHRNVDAPIVFVTTGIFAIYGRKSIFRPGIDQVLIDEAHATLESEQSVELALAICRQRGIRTDFMSATVDTTHMEAFPGVRVIRALPKRFPVWIHNTKSPLEECIVDLVANTLVRFNAASPYAPAPEEKRTNKIIKAVSETDRAKGMLIIITSYADERSEAQRVRRLLQAAPYSSKIEIRVLASETLRDREQKEQYLADLERWQRQKSRYVLIATSVVEMGVTLPDLDFIVTTDEGFTVDDATDGRMLRGPLGANALIQRIGRAGRVRPGIAFITRNIGAPYTELDDKELNSEKCLIPEPINFPMRSGPLTWLAFHSFAEEWHPKKLREHLTALALPTPIPPNSERSRAFFSERQKLRDIGAAKNPRLTPEGKRLERWIGRFELAYIIELLRAYESKDNPRIVKAINDCVLKKLGGQLPLPKELSEEAADDSVVERDYRGGKVKINRLNDSEAALDVVHTFFTAYLPHRTGPWTSWYGSTSVPLKIKQRSHFFTFLILIL